MNETKCLGARCNCHDDPKMQHSVEPATPEERARVALERYQETHILASDPLLHSLIADAIREAVADARDDALEEAARIADERDE